MKSIQAINRILPGINGPNSTKPEFLPSYPYVLCFNAKLPVTNSLKLFLTASPCQQQFAPLLKHKRYASVSKCRQGTAVCRLGGEDKSASGDNEGSQWEAIEKAMGNFGKQESIEDMLKQQIEKEYNDEGSGKAPPRGGGGNGGGRGDGFRGSEDDGLFGILDETLQVILATIGFICLYIHIITEGDLALLGRDFIKFLFGRKKSVRLRRAMEKWGRLFKKLTEKKEYKYDKYWLQKAIITTPTWYDSPAKYRRILRSYLK